MGRKWGLCPFRGGGAGSPPNTMWPGPRPTGVPSFVLIRPTVWPQCTNVTDRQTGRTDRQRTDSIGRTVLQTVAQKNEMLGKKRFNNKVLGLSPEIQKRYQKTLLGYNNEPDLLRYVTTLLNILTFVNNRIRIFGLVMS